MNLEAVENELRKNYVEKNYQKIDEMKDEITSLCNYNPEYYCNWVLPILIKGKLDSFYDTTESSSNEHQNNLFDEFNFILKTFPIQNIPVSLIEQMYLITTYFDIDLN